MFIFRESPSIRIPSDYETQRRISYQQHDYLDHYSHVRANIAHNSIRQSSSPVWNIPSSSSIRNTYTPQYSISVQPERVPSIPKHFIKKASPNYPFLASCLAVIGRNFNEFDLNFNNNNYQSDVPVYDPEYSFVLEKFGTRNFDINEIRKIENPFLLLRYELKKYQYKVTHGKVTEMDLFHATSELNIPGICEKNFDWRLRGE